MSYRDPLKIGMSPQELIEILGDPDHREEMSISAEWQWDRVIDDEKEYNAVIDFTEKRRESPLFQMWG